MDGLPWRWVLNHRGTESALRCPEASESWKSPFFTKEQQTALRVAKKRADGMNIGVKQLMDSFAFGLEVNNLLLFYFEPCNIYSVALRV